MEGKRIISVPQLFSMLFISRMVVSVTYSSAISGGGDMWDHVLSAIISFLITFVLVIPVYKMFYNEPYMDIIDNSMSAFGGMGTIVVLIYALYYILVCVFTLAIFMDFVSNVINPPISIILLAFGVIIASCYGAYKGIEGLARTSALILILIIGAAFFIGISLSAGVDKINYSPLLYNGTGSMWKGVMFMVSRTSCIPAMAMLIPLAKGNIKKGIITWNVSIYFIIAVLITLIVGTLGDYNKTQLFPVYTAASIAKIGPLEHLDAMYLGIWTVGIFVKMSLFLMLSSKCVRKIFGKAAGKATVLWIGGAVLIAGIFAGSPYDTSGVFSTPFLLGFMLLTSVIIPLILLFVRNMKKEARRRQVED